MIRILNIFFVILAGCILLGFIVSKVEKKKGWVEEHKPNGVYEKSVKRALDFALALFALILFLPLFLVIAVMVRINMGKPVIFEQERPGLGGKIFKIYKFRTMRDLRDSEGQLLPDEQRLTKLGICLRRLSGDELSELWNIIRGDLSIVGPRPLLKEYMPYYSKEESHRHDVRPGLTGLSQISGRNNLDWDLRFEMDVEYVNNISFLLDAKIVIKTIKKVLFHEGVLEDTAKGETNFAEERRAGRI